MLGVCSITVGTKFQSSIRHKVRKLRAKVRSLMPMAACHNHQKRNLKIEKIQNRRGRQCYSSKSSTHENRNNGDVWRFGLDRTDKWYTEASFHDDHEWEKNKHSKYQFEKLKMKEIQEINQDKLYYLGEQNLKAYNDFLTTLKINQNLKTFHQIIREKNYFNQNMQQVAQRKFNSISVHGNSAKKDHIKQSHILQSFHGENTTQLKSSPLIQSNENEKGRISATNLSRWKAESSKSIPVGKGGQTLSQLIFSRKKQNQNVPHHQVSNENRKQQIIQNDIEKRLYQKMKIQIQMAKAQANQKQLKQVEQNRRNALNQKSKQRHEKAIKKKSILMNKGEIVKIGSQLREIMLKRKGIKKDDSNQNKNNYRNI